MIGAALLNIADQTVPQNQKACRQQLHFQRKAVLAETQTEMFHLVLILFPIRIVLLLLLLLSFCLFVCLKKKLSGMRESVRTQTAGQTTSTGLHPSFKHCNN